jgi:uncharacterized protein YfaS (alpha-2-macroglobulin family)
MNYRICLLGLCCLACVNFSAMAQKNNYDKLWASVESLMQKNLPKSALTEANAIYAKAKAEKNDAQVIKALVVKSQLIQQVEEDNWSKTIAELEKEALTASAPARQIIYNITAGVYHAYYQAYGWKIYNRTKTTNFEKTDPETWTEDDFNTKISALYEASLTPEALLQQTQLSQYEPIILKGNQRQLRPTLFDLLAHEAIAYYTQEDGDPDRAANAFELNDYASLADPKTFARFTYTSPDTGSNLLKAIQLYQRLTRFHLADANPAALLDLTIDRLEFAQENSVNPFKSQLYKETLELLYTNYGNTPEAMQAGYLLAQWWHQKGQDYSPETGTTIDKMAFAQALELARQVAKKYPDSEGATNARNLAANIETEALDLVTEKVNLPGQPFRALLSFKNLSTAYLRIVSVTPEVEAVMDNNRYGDDYWAKLTALQPMQSWQQALPKTADYRLHSAEIKMPSLPTGKYLLIGSAQADFKTDANPLVVTLFYTSNISYVNAGNAYYLLHRQTGKPLANASVQVWESGYDYNIRRNKKTKGELLTTNANGFCQLSNMQKAGRSLTLDIRHGKDRLFLDEAEYHYRSSDENPDTDGNDAAQYFFFLDRSIYRPGQLMYFKALGISKKAGTQLSSAYVPKKPITVRLKDANGQVVDSLTLNANSYGSIKGKFTLPLGGLTGEFSLSIQHSKQQFTKTFSVEEYKRPKFYVSYDTLKKTFKLNSEITVTGQAKAYAGNAIDGAVVKYRVYRQTRFLCPWLFWNRGGWPGAGREKQELTKGEATTQADGSFSITFTALPDLSVDRALEPSFDYVVETDITDGNGETRSAETMVTIGYKALIMNLQMAGGLMQDAQNLPTLSVAITNQASVAQPATARVNIYPLKAPNRLIRARYWDAPDTTVMDYAAFVKLFPNDAYRNDDKYQSWEKGPLLATLTSNNTAKGPETLQLPTLDAGWYVLEATTTDADGQTVTAITHVAVYNSKTGQLPSPHYNFELPLQATVEPGATARFIQASSAPDLFVVEDIQKQNTKPAAGKDATARYTSINNQPKTLEFPVTEADRGGYAINRFFVVHNRLYTSNWQVNVPWSNKVLAISFGTFRDKLLPGQNEIWTVTIKGPKGEAAAAEMLAGMYDASLDQFTPHQWQQPRVWPLHYFVNPWHSTNGFGVAQSQQHEVYRRGEFYDKTYDQLIDIENIGGRLYGRVAGVQLMGTKSMEGAMSESAVMMNFTPPKVVADEEILDSVGNTEETKKNFTGTLVTIKKPPLDNAPQIRKNFNETAFFFPDLTTDAAGNISFSFTMPEALTQWNLQTFAHTKDLQMAMANRTVVTQKELMVQPFAPRFLRQGDALQFSTKVVNMAAAVATGDVVLELFDSETMAPLNSVFGNEKNSQPFTLAAGQSQPYSFAINIPKSYNGAVTYRLVAKTATASDGEEMALPVLTNRQLVTESFPINLRNTNEKTVVWQRFNDVNKALTPGGSLQNHGLTVEYTSNPAWYAVQALPYLMEYPYDCAEQTWNRFNANAMAAHIANSAPRIKAVFTQWKNTDKAALLSNLQKNQELKALLLEETPWVMDAQNEAQQKQNIGLLFDLVRMSNEAEKALDKLSAMQSGNGGFVWFSGGPDDRYITQYIATGLGHLRQLNAWPSAQKADLQKIAAKAIPYLDARIADDYNTLLRLKADLSKVQLSSMAIQYLYMRSFFTDYPLAQNAKPAVEFYREQAKKYWPTQSKYAQGMIALALHRAKDAATAQAILKSLTENSITNNEFGMYWKEFNTGGYYWWQAPIESHALLIEAYAEIEQNRNRINDLKTWLLKQKQTQNWETTRATAEACYALLLQGDNWLAEEKTVSILLGDTKLEPAANSLEAGTGYFKQRIAAADIKPNMGNISVSVSPAKASGSSSWGAVYWQYFEDLDKITTAASPLSISKQLFVKTNGSKGPELTPVGPNARLKVGDKVTVRIELRSDRNLEYVHLKDMRASCFEPTNVLSQYKYHGGLGYYEATRDASTNFFIGSMAKGTYVFEYTVLVTHKGSFGNGISSIQCMYAPEFGAHSQGIRVTVE